MMQRLYLRPSVALMTVLLLAQDPARYRELKRVVDHNTGHMHGVRGMNAFTQYALRECVTEKDFPVLGELLEDKDNITAMTASYVLADMGDSGRAVIETHIKTAVPVARRMMFEETLAYVRAPSYRPILKYPLTDADRRRIRGCRK